MAHASGMPRQLVRAIAVRVSSFASVTSAPRQWPIKPPVLVAETSTMARRQSGKLVQGAARLVMKTEEAWSED